MLLGNVVSPYGSGDHVDPASYAFEDLSLPLNGGGCSLAATLEGQDLNDIANFSSSLLLSDDEFCRKVGVEGRARAYWDPLLGKGGSEYIRLITELNSPNK